MGKYVLFYVAACIYVFSLLTENAYAYIDPGTGSMLLQAIAACAVAVLIFGKRIYYGVIGMMGGKKTDDAAQTSADSDDTSAS